MKSTESEAKIACQENHNDVLTAVENAKVRYRDIYIKDSIGSGIGRPSNFMNSKLMSRSRVPCGRVVCSTSWPPRCFSMALLY